MKNIVINAFNKRYINQLKINNVLNKNSYYDKGCEFLLLQIINRYSTIYDKAVMYLNEMGYDTIVCNGKVSFVSNKPYTNQNITFEERFALLSVSDC